MCSVDRTKSLQELEGQDWGEPTYDSHLVRTCHVLRRKPLDQFTVEDLRIMIGQGISLPILVPLAIERLEEEPLVAGDIYEGDLLAAVAKIEEGFWTNRASLLERMRQVIGRAKRAGAVNWSMTP
jgi:CDI immunity proteins